MFTIEAAAIAACVAFTLISCGDFHSTRWILSIGGQELNPVVRWLIARCGVSVGLAIAKLASVAAVWVAWYAGAWTMPVDLAGLLQLPIGLLALAGMCAFYLAVVTNNYRQIKTQIAINAARATAQI